jgi:hypothetical protein
LSTADYHARSVGELAGQRPSRAAVAIGEPAVADDTATPDASGPALVFEETGCRAAIDGIVKEAVKERGGEA